jgi:crotonobetainyl-CoA:carnitine CoA-transferase CaiB-like acyl-CoA transferase
MNNKPILDGVTVLAFTQYIFETSPITPLTELLKENGAQIIQVQYASEFMEKEKSEMKQNEERQSEQKLKLNLKKKKVRDFVLQHLISKCDIIVEAFRPGVMEKFGLSPISVHRVNPKVIYVRISGFGHNEEIPEIIDASRDLNYLAKAGLL